MRGHGWVMEVYNFNPRSREGSDAGKARYRGCFYISIHAPAKGATQHGRLNPRCSGFQSTLPRRERPVHFTMQLHLLRFQSTLPRRERRGLAAIGINQIPFQSTLPRRERHSPDRYHNNDRNFNPRSREGSDLKHLLRYNFPTDFNPRSREGSDRIVSSDSKSATIISIHAPAKGATGT